MWDSKSQILIENSAPYLLLAQAITTERGRTHPHFGRSGQEQIALKKNVEHSEFALPRGSLGITYAAFLHASWYTVCRQSGT